MEVEGYLFRRDYFTIVAAQRCRYLGEGDHP
jgi:hypothetical protein